MSMATSDRSSKQTTTYTFFLEDWKWYRATKYSWKPLGNDIERPYEPFIKPRIKAPQQYAEFKPYLTQDPFLVADHNCTMESEEILTMPLLYKKFASLDGSQNSFLEFALKYGNLGNGCFIQTHRNSDTYSYGESLYFWQIEQWNMKMFNILEEALRDGNVHRFGDFEWDRVNRFSFTIGLPEDVRDFNLNSGGIGNPWYETPYYMGIGKLISHGHKNNRVVWHGRRLKNEFDLFPVNDPTKSVRSLLSSALRHRLGNGIGQRLVWNDEIQAFDRKYVPETLLSALWLQFSYILTGERKIKRCPVCHDWIDVTGMKRSLKKHPNCKNRDGVARMRTQNQIKELLENGLSLVEIYNILNLDSRVVERWKKESNSFRIISEQNK